MDKFNSYVYTFKNDESWSAAVFSCLYNRNPLNGISEIASFQSKIADLLG
ncbi:MAG: hypothetical protein LUF82_00810 [Clostridia bacterium]|nr:hypothetical protein [Clostridia bacterium]